MNEQLQEIDYTVREVLANRHTVNARVNTLEKDMELLKREIKLHEEAIKLCSFVLDARTDLLVHVEDMASSMLKASFGDGYTFRFEKTYKTDGVTISGVKPVVIFEDGEPEEILDNGGGLQNNVSFSLRLAFTLLQDDLSPVLILDEPWVNLSDITPIVDFINELNKEIDMQVIIVTHKETGDDIEAVTYRVKKRAGGISRVEIDG